MLSHCFSGWHEDSAFKEKTRQIQLNIEIESLMRMAIKVESINPTLSEKLFEKAAQLEKIK